jgi:hypothetical protein
VSFQPEFWVLRDVIPLKLKRHFLLSQDTEFVSKVTTPPKAGEKNQIIKDIISDGAAASKHGFANAF